MAAMQQVLAAGRAIPATCTFAGRINSATGTTTKTFTNVPIGTASATRYALVAIITNSVPTTFSAVTIGGAAATILYTATNANTTMAFAISNAPIASGTTATVVATGTANPTVSACAGWAVENLASTSIDDSDSTTVDNGVLPMTVLSNGFVVGANLGSSAVWTGLTKQGTDANNESFASQDTLTAGTLNVSCDNTSHTLTAAISMH